MKRFAIAILMLGGCVYGAVAESAWLPASAQELPRWRGFNLLNKFMLEWSNGPFEEEDFRLIHELGFNFVRLPMDYRVWIVDGDWRRFNEAVFKEIDQAVAWGGRYGIHVCICFHRAPGYTVAQPEEAANLWTDPEAQAVCAQHWAHFARRYQGIPNERLSFNLFNEPGEVSGGDYARVAKILVDAIRTEDPERLIIADGPYWGRKPCPELIPLGVAQATRGYEPSNISHYRAEWIDSKGMPEPTWPLPLTNQFLFGPGKPELQAPLRIEGPFADGLELRVRIGTVSVRGHLVVSADGAAIWEHEFVCGPGDGEWKEAVFKEEWQAYQNRYDRDYSITVPKGAAAVELNNTEGDWMSIVEVGVRAPGATDGAEGVLHLMVAWGTPNPPIAVVHGDEGWTFVSPEMVDRESLWRDFVVPWQSVERQGVGVMVGEWGAYNKTPHAVTLRWMEDCLRNWQAAGWGWALWNFRGSFGVLDSGREDVVYEAWRGHGLDRGMLELLQQY